MKRAERTGIVDPITAEVIRNKLEGIANEMELTLLKSSFSPIVKEGLDTSASLFTASGETLAQACAIPVHLATLIPTIKSMLERFPLETMREGDAYILNDPYCGGTHLPDIALMTPVFHRGRVIALSATMTHHGDIGGWRFLQADLHVLVVMAVRKIRAKAKVRRRTNDAMDAFVGQLSEPLAHVAAEDADAHSSCQSLWLKSPGGRPTSGSPSSRR